MIFDEQVEQKDQLSVPLVLSENESFKHTTRAADLINSHGDESTTMQDFQQSRNYLPGTLSTIVQYDEICVTCGLKLSHWYHYYSDIYGPFLFHRCPKSAQSRAKLTKGCFYYFKFIIWFALLPLLTFFALICMVFGGFKTFVFQPIHFEFSNMNRNQRCKWKCPVYILYVILSLVLLLLELLLPLLATPICIIIGYFIHIYGFVMHRRHRINSKRASQKALSEDQVL